MRPGVLGHVGAGEQLLEEGRVADRPGLDAEDVHPGGRAALAQDAVLGVMTGAGGVEDEGGLLGRHDLAP